MFNRFLFSLLLLAYLSWAEDAGGLNENAFRRTRHKAAVLALLRYNPTPTVALKKEFACQSSCLQALCRMFVQEGGYYVKRVPAILEIRDPETAHVGLLLAELDGRLPANAAPRTLQMACAVALAYTIPSPSGVYAAVHAGRLVEADPDNDAVARAAYSLLVSIIEGKNDDKEQLLKIAAANADDERVAREIRALRLRDWRKLPDERTGAGRLCRALHIWLRANSWVESDRLGKQLLRYSESRRFLAVVSAAWFDLNGLPEDLVWESLNDRDTRELCTDLFQLANSGVLIQIDEKLVKNTPQENEQAVTVSAPPETVPEWTPPAPLRLPASPGAMSAPSMPAPPAAPAEIMPAEYVPVSYPVN